MHVVCKAAVSFCVLALPVSGQSLTAPSEWTMSGGEGSYCMSYLLSPENAARLAPKETVVAPAGRGEGLHPAVMRQVQDEPEFAKWIPAQICIGLYETVAISGQRTATMKPGKPIVVALHTMAATSYRGSPVNAVLLGLYTDNGTVSGGAGKTGQATHSIKRQTFPVKPGQEPKSQLQFDGVKLLWQGSAQGEASVQPTQRVSFGYTAQRGNLWLGVFEEAGGQGKTQYGGLGIEGKNDLAKALLASPIRAMGPLTVGGVGHIAFSFRAPR